MKKFKENQAGFTLIELIVVMIIIGILVLLATPRFIKYVKDANATSLQVDSKVIHDADLYKSIRAYEEAGKEKSKHRAKKEYTMEEISVLEYDHPIFKFGYDDEDLGQNHTASIPDFNGKSQNELRYDFDKWKAAMGGSFEEVTGLQVFERSTEEPTIGEIVFENNLPKFKDDTDPDMAKFNKRKYAALSDTKLSSHIRNTRYGVNNFIVATDGMAQEEVYYMGYIENGDNIMYVSLIPSGVVRER